MSELTPQQTVSDLLHTIIPESAPAEADPSLVLIANIAPTTLRSAVSYSNLQADLQQLDVDHFTLTHHITDSAAQTNERWLDITDRTIALGQQQMGQALDEPTVGAPDASTMDAIFELSEMAAETKATADAARSKAEKERAELLAAEFQILLNKQDAALATRVSREQHRLGRPMRIMVRATGSLAALGILAAPLVPVADASFNAKASSNISQERIEQARIIELGGSAALAAAFALTGSVVLRGPARKAGDKQAQRRAKRMIGS